jgi:hypothetical protein
MADNHSIDARLLQLFTMCHVLCGDRVRGSHNELDIDPNFSDWTNFVAGSRGPARAHMYVRYYAVHTLAVAFNEYCTAPVHYRALPRSPLFILGIVRCHMAMCNPDTPSQLAHLVVSDFLERILFHVYRFAWPVLIRTSSEFTDLLRPTLTFVSLPH